MKSVAIIGTRKLSDEGFEKLHKIARFLVRRGIRVRTGGAVRADEAAMKGAASVDPRMLDVFLPWENYNQKEKIIPNGSITYCYSEDSCPNWARSVDQYHPSPGSLSGGSRALMARNYGILMFPEPVDMVIAHPESLANEGGTGQGMRIARDKKIKLINMLVKADRLELNELLNGMK